jgi:hypothetical protein
LEIAAACEDDALGRCLAPRRAAARSGRKATKRNHGCTINSISQKRPPLSE